MRGTILLLVLITAASSTAIGQTNTRFTGYVRTVDSAAACRGADVSVRHVNEDAAMSGQNTIVYAFKNNSSTACTLKGYPRYELLDRSGKVRPRGRAINSQQLPGDEAKQAPQLVTIEPGKEAWFRVYYNSGGAGYMGKPCPVSRKVRIVAPGTTRLFSLQENVTSCRAVEVSAVRGGPLPE
ncbi:MAG TPA: DUF4232 domain-containing protein [Pyrinomonadaceae bacterium]|nr:DUF4232 domain-containing protein [Pyrinomonadaceae bacterium]